MTATVIQRVRELAASRLADAESRYTDLVELLAGGGMPDPENVLATLADVDRSDADLQL